MTSRDKLLLGIGVTLFGALGYYLIYVVITGLFFTLHAEAQVMGNGWLAAGLNRSIERALGDDAPEMLGEHCMRWEPGFAPAPECVFVDSTSGGPGCMTWDAENGRCHAVIVQASLLTDRRVLTVFEEASRQYCHYTRDPNERDASNWETVVGCHSPGPGWRLHARRAPVTICVVEKDGDRNRLAFAIRNGQRVRDRWCENVWAIARAEPPNHPNV